MKDDILWEWKVSQRYYKDRIFWESSEEFAAFIIIVNIRLHHQGSDIRTLMKETELVSKHVGLREPTVVTASPKRFYCITLKTRGV